VGRIAAQDDGRRGFGSLLRRERSTPALTGARVRRPGGGAHLEKLRVRSRSPATRQRVKHAAAADRDEALSIFQEPGLRGSATTLEAHVPSTSRPGCPSGRRKGSPITTCRARPKRVSALGYCAKTSSNEPSCQPTICAVGIFASPNRRRALVDFVARLRASRQNGRNAVRRPRRRKAPDAAAKERDIRPRWSSAN